MTTEKIESLTIQLTAKEKELQQEQLHLHALHGTLQELSTAVAKSQKKISQVLVEAGNIANQEITIQKMGLVCGDTPKEQLDYLNTIYDEFEKCQDSYRKIAQKTRETFDFWQSLQELLEAHPDQFPKQELIDKANLWLAALGTKHVQKEKIETLDHSNTNNLATQDGFKWLLNQLKLNENDFGLFHRASFKHNTFTKGLSSKMAQLTDLMNEDKKQDESYTRALQDIKTLKEKLIQNQKEKEELESQLRLEQEKKGPLELTVEHFAKEVHQLKETLATEQSAYEQQQLKQEQEERARQSRETIAQEIERLFFDYQNARDARVSLAIKDKLSPADKQERDQYISTINEQCKHFITTADATEVLQTLANAISRFPGVHLRTKLHQAILKLMPATPNEDHSEESQALLNKISSEDRRHEPYVNAMRTLYHRIGMMEAFAQDHLSAEERTEVQNLCGQLRKDADFFVIQHLDPTKISKEQYEEFKFKLNARLHSKDDFMSRHESWGPLLFNIFLGVITVGIALGIKALHSKLNNNCVSFFFSETNKERNRKQFTHVFEKISEVEKTAPERQELLSM